MTIREKEENEKVYSTTFYKYHWK